jgi:small subunit ribosomal protein S1
MIDDADAAQRDEAADELAKSLARSSQEVRNARVIRIDNEFVWLDIGFKFESVLPLSSWQDDSPPNVGDEIMVLIEDDLDVDDRPLTIARVHVTRRHPGWRFVANAKPGDVHSGRITRRIAGGFLVNIGVNVFLPDEHLPQEMLANPEAHIGQTGDWRITKVDVKEMSIQIAPVKE